MIQPPDWEFLHVRKHWGAVTACPLCFPHCLYRPTDHPLGAEAQDRKAQSQSRQFSPLYAFRLNEPNSGIRIFPCERAWQIDVRQFSHCKFMFLWLKGPSVFFPSLLPQTTHLMKEESILNYAHRSIHTAQQGCKNAFTHPFTCSNIFLRTCYRQSLVLMAARLSVTQCSALMLFVS